MFLCIVIQNITLLSTVAQKRGSAPEAHKNNKKYCELRILLTFVLQSPSGMVIFSVWNSKMLNFSTDYNKCWYTNFLPVGY